MRLPQTRRTLLALVFMNVLMLVPLGLYLSGTVSMRRTSDEYCVAVGARELGAVGNAAFLYNNIDGKFVGRTLLGLALSAGIPAAPFISIAMVILWWVVFFGIFRLICRDGVYRNWQAALATSVFTVILFLGLPRIERTLYSLNGTAYVFLATLLFAGYVWLILQSSLKNTPLTFALFLVIGFLIYDISDTVGIAALVALAGVYLASFARTEIPRTLRPRLLSALIGASIGLVSIFLAPGSQIRREVVGAGNIDWGYGLTYTLASLVVPGAIAFVQAPLAYLSLLGIAGLVGYFSPIPASAALRRAARQAMFFLLWLLASCSPPVLRHPRLYSAAVDHAVSVHRLGVLYRPLPQADFDCFDHARFQSVSRHPVGGHRRPERLIPRDKHRGQSACLRASLGQPRP